MMRLDIFLEEEKSDLDRLLIEAENPDDENRLRGLRNTYNLLSCRMESLGIDGMIPEFDPVVEYLKTANQITRKAMENLDYLPEAINRAADAAFALEMVLGRYEDTISSSEAGR